MPKPSEFAQLFVLQMNAKFEDQEFSIESGSKYDRIVQHHRGHSGEGSVHCFILKSSGEVFKSSGYRQPAKGARYPDVFAAVAASDKFGTYLYL